ncbi:DUF1778 domain-containing protein [Methylomarinum vadi]|uniref:DUF1778 domain-containing protein n=1 Tax=Methylomarinum vadi TaxID=438855 RepID=UPI0004DF7828|nr:DUF1778 domain-containing protein [Methylomarinum vadi]
MRLSIEVTAEQHQKLKAIAALSGKSIKDYVLERVFSEENAENDEEALRQLEAFLEPRIKMAQEEPLSSKSIKQIFEETQQESR